MFDSYFTDQFESMVLLAIFVLIFVIVYAILTVTKMFDDKGPRIGLAFVMAVSTIVPHMLGLYPECWDIVEILRESLPLVGLGMLGAIMFIIIIAIIGVKKPTMEIIQGLVVIAAIAYIVYAFISYTTTCYNIDMGVNWRSYVVPVILAVLFFAVIFFITRKANKEEE